MVNLLVKPPLFMTWWINESCTNVLSLYKIAEKLPQTALCGINEVPPF